MRIVIDLQGAQTESRFRGIGRYTLALCRAIAQKRGEHDVIIVVNGFFPEALNDIFQAFDGILPKENITIWQALGPVRECDASNHSRLRVAETIREHFIASLCPDVVFIPSLFEGHIDNGVTSVKCFFQIPTLVLVYDLIPLINWESYLGTDEIYAQYYQRKLESLRRADHLLTISNSALLEVKTALGLPDQSIRTIWAGCAPEFQPGKLSYEEKSHFLSQWDISKPFIFYSGGDEPRKNIKKFITACGLLPDFIQDKYQIVLLGRIPESRVKTLTEFSVSCGLKLENLIFIEYVSDSALINLYRLCEVFVLPSLHEGFGLPALEAMSCGAAVIGSNTTSIPEVIECSDALFNPNDEVDISRKLEAVLSDESFRAELKVQGLRQARKFSWEASAKRALEAIESLCPTVSEKKDWRSFLENKESDYQALIRSIVSLLPAEISSEELVDISACVEKNEKETRRVLSRSQLSSPINWRIEGPFDSTYSLALLNRETAKSLKAMGHDVALHSTEGPGDFTPNSKYLQKNPDVFELYKKSMVESPIEASITSRILYPPRVADMQCRLNLLHHYAWEESGFPSEWVDDFNRYLDGITYLSKHVEKILIDHGITLPGAVSGSGVDHWERLESCSPYELKANRFRFLHVSSCFPRKGVDVLLRAYGDSFSISDDVSLVIKTHPNPHNEVHSLLEKLRLERSDFPDVLIIEEDLSDAALKSLYKQCHILVAPSRAEGFGLPLAEAMLSRLPVITTGWGGQLDFCSSKTAWLIDYDFERAQTHFNLYDSVWAEPKRAHLAQTMREVYELPDAERLQRSTLGREILLRDFSWEKVTQRLVSFAQTVGKRGFECSPKIGWVTSWNTRCGIATYSAHLIDCMPEAKKVKIFAAKADLRTADDTANITRCWEPHDNEDLSHLVESINNESIDVLVIQFNHGFFNFENLNQFLLDQARVGRVLILMLHSTAVPAHVPHKKLSTLVAGMKSCKRILVHSVDDLNRLKELNVVENVTLFPHGILDFNNTDYSYEGNVFKIASFGFFLPHKGLLELMDAAEILHNRGLKVSLSMLNSEYPAPVSKEIIDQAFTKAKNSPAKIEIYTDYLSELECLEKMSKMDLVVFPYRNTEESSSAAVRSAIASGAPVAVTPIPIFDDVRPAVHILSGMSAQDIADSISELIWRTYENDSCLKMKNESAALWRDSHRYSKLGRRLYNMLCALYRDGKNKSSLSNDSIRH